MVRGRFSLAISQRALCATVFTVLVACGGDAEKEPSPASPTTPAPSLSPGVESTVAWRALDHLDEATLSLPAHNRASETPHTESSVLSDWKSVKARTAGLQHYQHPLPLSIPPKRYKQAPLDLVLLQGGKALPYNANLDRDSKRAGWMVKGSNLLLASATAPNTPNGQVLLDHSAFSENQNRLAFEKAKLSKSEFVSMEVTLGRETRRTLFLPAPSQAEWSIQIPDQAVLSFGIGIRDRPLLSEAAGDGVEFSVLVNGKSIWTDKASPEKPFEEHDVSLSEYAGQTVQLALVTAPRKNATNDFAVWSSPRIVGTPAGEVRRVIVIGALCTGLNFVGTVHIERRADIGLADIPIFLKSARSDHDGGSAA